MTPSVNTPAKITLMAGQSVAVFPTEDDLRKWVYTGALSVRIHTHNGIALPVVNPGEYNCTVLDRFGTSSRTYTVYGQIYATPRYHPRIRFPYHAWAIVRPSNTI